MNPLAASNHPISLAFHSLARFKVCSASARQLRSTIIVQKGAYIGLAIRKTHHTKSGYLLATASFSSGRGSYIPILGAGRTVLRKLTNIVILASFDLFVGLRQCRAQPSICCHERASKQADRPLKTGIARQEGSTRLELQPRVQLGGQRSGCGRRVQI